MTESARNIIIKLNSDAVHQHVRHTCSPILHKPCTFLWIWYSENTSTRIHSYVHLWYASPKRVPTSTNHQNAYRSQKRLPASGKLTSTKTLTNLKSAYLLTTSPVATENSNTQFGNYFLVDFLVFEVNLNLLSVMILYVIEVSINFNFFVDPIQYFKVFSIRFFVHNVSNYHENLFIIRLLSTYMSFFLNYEERFLPHSLAHPPRKIQLKPPYSHWCFSAKYIKKLDIFWITLGENVKIYSKKLKSTLKY